MLYTYLANNTTHKLPWSFCTLVQILNLLNNTIKFNEKLKKHAEYTLSLRL